MKQINCRSLCNLMLLLAITVGAIFTSCKKDDLDGASDEGAVAAITGTWKGSITWNKGSSMTATFDSDGKVKIWWTENPLLDSYYFEGDYTISKKKIRFKGLACSQGSSLSSGWEVDETSGYTIRDGVLSFEFSLHQSWELKAQ